MSARRSNSPAPSSWRRPRLRRAVVAAAFLGAVALTIHLGRAPRAEAGVDAEEVGFRLEEVAREAGIDFVHRPTTLDPKLAHIAPHVAGMGASVAVGDADGDGLPDLYFTTSRFGHPNALYMNEGDGTFQDVAAEAGVADLNREGEGVSMGALWADVDNDGREDLLVYGWGRQRLLRNVSDADGVRFRDISEVSGLGRWMNANGAVWFDYDRDGLVDLYLAGYFRSDVDMWDLASTRIMHDSFEFSSNGGAAVPEPGRRPLRGRHGGHGGGEHPLDPGRGGGGLRRRRLA